MTTGELMVKSKIGGITSEKDAFYTTTCGADFIGFNFWPDSLRYIAIKTAQKIIAGLPPGVITPVGVFVNAEMNEIIDVTKKCNLKHVQLHGSETPEFVDRFKQSYPDIIVIKAFKIKGEGTLRYISQFKDIADYFLFDAFVPGEEGGTGATFNWDIAIEAKKYDKPVFLAGGLTPENVIEAIEKVQPYAVDVATGVERLPKRKDFDKLKQFIVNVRKVR
jgi:phosphoribosylanthranilate isomerase